MTWTTRPRSEIGSLATIHAGRDDCSGKPLIVLLHGVGLRAEAWCLQIDELKQGCEVLAFDMPGHGASPPPEGTGSLSDYSLPIAAAIPRPAVIAGHSMGAMIALDIAARFPEKVKGVAALNAIYRRDRAAQEAVASRTASLNGMSMPDPEPTLERWFAKVQSAERAACKTWLKTVDPEGYRQAYAVFANEDGPTDTALRKLQMPALFMTGELEPNSTPAMSRTMASLAPGGRVVIAAGAAHMMPMTHGALVNRELLSLIGSCCQ